MLTVERLSQMRVKEHYAVQAEALLSHLAIFQRPFGRSAIVGMAPQNMHKETYIAAFAALRSWNIIKQLSSKRFFIEESVRILFPPTDAIRLQQLMFFLGCVSVHDQIWAKLRWTDLASALQWGLAFQPTLGVKFAGKIKYNMHFASPNEYYAIMEVIYRAATQQRHIEMQAYALRELERISR